MSRDEIVRHWQEGAWKSLQLAQAAVKIGSFDLALFHCHLAVEKALKAAYMARHDEDHPYTHELLPIAQALTCEWTEQQLEDLETLSNFSVKARYDDVEWAATYATRKQAEDWIKKAEQFLSLLCPSDATTD